MTPSATYAPFPHQRLDAYTVAVDLAVAAKALSDRVPRGLRGLADQLLRAGTAVPLLVAEGADRCAAGTKRQRFAEARGEAGECAAAIELGLRLGLFSPAEGQAATQLASRVSAMLTRLIQRFA